MTGFATAPAGERQRTCALLAATLSEGRRWDARLVTGDRRAFSLNRSRTVVYVPSPDLGHGWSPRTSTVGIALQCAPTKDRLAGYDLVDLSDREQLAVSIVEGRAAVGWLARRWPGLLPECERVLGSLELADPEMEAADIISAAIELVRTGSPLSAHPLMGRLPHGAAPRGLAASLHRRFGRMPWSSRRSDRQRILSIPVGGEGGVHNPNLPPPSRPEDEELEIRPDERVGIPYPEWNAWTGRFLPDHVAVLEQPVAAATSQQLRVGVGVRKWFEQHTHRTMRSGLEDGCDLAIDRYVDHYIATVAGEASEPRVFRDLQPAHRDVTTALLLDGSSSLGVRGGTVFELELACADALSQAMTLAGERHGLFAFTGHTRHRVEVRCLKDFAQARHVMPSTLGLVTGGYTRLGAPIRHLTSRLLAQPSERRLLILIGDGLMCDEGYEGRYAWADVTHAVQEADEAGVAIYYIGLGTPRVDPLPEVFGPRRSQRIRRVEELPRVLAHVHRELVAA